MSYARRRTAEPALDAASRLRLLYETIRRHRETRKTLRVSRADNGSVAAVPSVAVFQVAVTLDVHG